MPARYHVLQAHPSSCLAACLEMVFRRQGASVSEADILAEYSHAWAPGGLDIAVAAQVLGQKSEFYPESREGNEQMLSTVRQYLRTGHWIAAFVVCRRYRSWLANLPAPPVSPWGKLSTRLHAIVLCGAQHDGFDYLDPFFPAQGQPFRIDDDSLALILSHFIPSPVP